MCLERTLMGTIKQLRPVLASESDRVHFPYSQSWAELSSCKIRYLDVPTRNATWPYVAIGLFTEAIMSNAVLWVGPNPTGQVSQGAEMRTRTHTHRGETKWAHGHKAAPSKPRREASDGTPWPWTSGLQNCETMPVFRVSRPGQPVALWFGGPGRLMPLTLSVSSPPILNIASFFYHLRFTVFPNSHLFLLHGTPLYPFLRDSLLVV